MEPRRHLALEGTWNIRDLGGYATSDGKRTRWKTLLRGDVLHGLPPASRNAIIDYGVRTVIDLRKADEVRRQPNDFAGSPHVAYYHQDLVGDAPLTGIVDDSSFSGESKRVVINRTDVDRVSYAVILDHSRARVSETLATLAEPGVLPALFHCGVGKDRTGLIAALVLGLAGVPTGTIAEDYALSARYLAPLYLSEQASPEEVAAGYDWHDFQREYCHPDAMFETLRHLDEIYGGVEAYALEAGLTRERITWLRSALVEWTPDPTNPWGSLE